MNHVISRVGTELVVLADNGTTQPISVLDRHKLTGDPNGQIGIRYWNEKWRDYSFCVTTVTEGTDVSVFINQGNNQ